MVEDREVSIFLHRSVRRRLQSEGFSEVCTPLPLRFFECIGTWTWVEVVAALNVDHLLLESDSLSTIKLLQAPAVTTHRDYFLIHRCKRLLVAHPWEVKLTHIPRSENKAVDYMANLSLELSASACQFSSSRANLLHFISDDILSAVINDSH